MKHFFLILCKRSKFSQPDKWYSHEPESVLKNDTHKIIRDSKILTDHQILARRPDLVPIDRPPNPSQKTDLVLINGAEDQTLYQLMDHQIPARRQI